MKNYLFSIGISQYSHWGNLNNAARDATALSSLLISKYQFDKENHQELLDSDATLNDIFYHLEFYLNNLTPQDNLIVLFCGHGWYDADLNEGYWIPHEGRRGSRTTMLSISSLEKFIQAFKAHHVLVISDSCFSGSLFRGGDTDIATSRTYEKLYKIPSRWALTSGRIEAVSDGVVGKQSPFAQSILSKLDIDEPMPLSISELSNIVIGEVGATREQIPRGEPLGVPGHSGGQFIFYPKNYKLDLAQRVQLEEKQIPQYLLNLFDEYNSNLSVMRSLAGEQKYLEAAESRDIKDLSLEKLLVEIEKSLEEFKFENTSNIEGMFNTSAIDSIREQLKEVRNRKMQMIRSQKYEQAAMIRDEEMALIAENSHLIQGHVKAYKEKCLELVNGNIYVLYSFISHFLVELPFDKIYDTQEKVQSALKNKFIIELAKESKAYDAIDLAIQEGEVNSKLLRLIRDL